MKIFWSWQSDTPGKIGRHFVKEALEIAIAELQTEIEIDEPNRELHLDHDRKGVPGSPDLANTILDKIRATSIFVADVTPVGKTEGGKLVMNPNVAIELGYALTSIGNQGLLMVLNDYYGDRESLPFDLKQKAGPIIYSLSPVDSKENLKKEQRSLSGTLKVAIRDCITAIKKGRNTEAQHNEVKATNNSAEYYNAGEALAEREVNDNVFRVIYDSSPLLYLRVIPELAYPPLKQSEVKDIVYGIKIAPLRRFVGTGSSWERNRFGGITYSNVTNTNGENIFTTSQVFLNREIWGIDATLLSDYNSIPSIELEILFEKALKHYIDVAEKLLSLKPPLIIEAGATAVNGFTIEMPNIYFERHWGPIYNDEIKSRHILTSLNVNYVDKILLKIYEDFFDAVGERRPENFRGFPSKE
jgi:hypothetical protein